MPQYNTLKFASKQQDFFVTLNKRVNEYFKTNNLSRHANSEMKIKTVFMFLLYFVPYALIMSGQFTNLGTLFLFCVIMGFGIGGIGLSVMHDANHGAYSKKPWVNNLLGYSLNLIGASAFNWKLQHNVLHHTYTNIHEADEDISPRGVLRMHPDSDWKGIHKFQHIYSWFLYGLMTLVWVFVKDYVRIINYEKIGLTQKQKANMRTEWIILIATKLAYFTYIFVIPVLILPFVTWWQVLIGFFTMHYIAGFILAIIFQPAHVIDGTEYPLPDGEGQLENNWAIHQMLTTTNFANKSTAFSWYVGGLNFQVEHHLFPNICHVHYKQISKIVEATAHEFGVPYKSEPTFLDALVGHAKLLKQLGVKPVAVVEPVTATEFQPTVTFR
jgi:linoleoyl-CoA desaturase